MSDKKRVEQYLLQTRAKNIVLEPAVRSQISRFAPQDIDRIRLLRAQQIAGQVPVSEALKKQSKKKKKKARRTKQLRGDLSANLREQRRFTQGERREKDTEEPRIVGDPAPAPAGFAYDPAIERRRLDIEEARDRQRQLERIADRREEARRQDAELAVRRGELAAGRADRALIRAAPPAPPLVIPPAAAPVINIAAPPPAQVRVEAPQVRVEGPRVEVAPVINIPPQEAPLPARADADPIPEIQRLGAEIRADRDAYGAEQDERNRDLFRQFREAAEFESRQIRQSVDAIEARQQAQDENRRADARRQDAINDELQVRLGLGELSIGQARDEVIQELRDAEGRLRGAQRDLDRPVAVDDIILAADRELEAEQPVRVDVEEVDSPTPRPAVTLDVLRERAKALRAPEPEPEEPAGIAGVIAGGGELQLPDVVVDRPGLIGSPQRSDEEIDRLRREQLERETPLKPGKAVRLKDLKKTARQLGATGEQIDLFEGADQFDFYPMTQIRDNLISFIVQKERENRRISGGGGGAVPATPIDKQRLGDRLRVIGGLSPGGGSAGRGLLHYVKQQFPDLGPAEIAELEAIQESEGEAGKPGNPGVVKYLTEKYGPGAAGLPGAGLPGAELAGFGELRSVDEPASPVNVARVLELSQQALREATPGLEEEELEEQEQEQDEIQRLRLVDTQDFLAGFERPAEQVGGAAGPAEQAARSQRIVPGGPPPQTRSEEKQRFAFEVADEFFENLAAQGVIDLEAAEPERVSSEEEVEFLPGQPVATYVSPREGGKGTPGKVAAGVQQFGGAAGAAEPERVIEDAGIQTVQPELRPLDPDVLFEAVEEAEEVGQVQDRRQQSIRDSNTLYGEAIPELAANVRTGPQGRRGQRGGVGYRLRNNTDRTLKKIKPGDVVNISGVESGASGEGRYRLDTETTTGTRVSSDQLGPLIDDGSLLFERGHRHELGGHFDQQPYGPPPVIAEEEEGPGLLQQGGEAVGGAAAAVVGGGARLAGGAALGVGQGLAAQLPAAGDVGAALGRGAVAGVVGVGRLAAGAVGALVGGGEEELEEEASD